MQLHLSILRDFSREAILEAASKSYDIRNEDGYICKDGGCFMYEVMKADSPLTASALFTRPAPSDIAKELGYYYPPEDDTDSESWIALTSIIDLVVANDEGKFSDPIVTLELLKDYLPQEEDND